METFLAASGTLFRLKTLTAALSALASFAYFCFISWPEHPMDPLSRRAIDRRFLITRRAEFHGLCPWVNGNSPKGVKHSLWFGTSATGYARGYPQVCPSCLGELVIFALNTGMRVGEIISLEWKGVDLFRKTVTVFKSKNKEPRAIPINETVFEMLKNKVRVRSISGLVFHSPFHTKLHITSIDHAFKKALKRAGIENFRFHDLRHGFASRIVQSGRDLYKVQRLLGHKSPTMTQRYAHHYPERLRDAVEVLDKRFTILAQ